MIAVILPCFNEGAAVADVVAQFRTALPAAEVYSSSTTTRRTTPSPKLVRAGAQVRHESRQGKGYVSPQRIRPDRG